MKFSATYPHTYTAKKLVANTANALLQRYGKGFFFLSFLC